MCRLINGLGFKIMFTLNVSSGLQTASLKLWLVFSSVKKATVLKLQTMTGIVPYEGCIYKSYAKRVSWSHEDPLIDYREIVDVQFFWILKQHYHVELYVFAESSLLHSALVVYNCWRTYTYSIRIIWYNSYTNIYHCWWHLMVYCE